ARDGERAREGVQIVNVPIAVANEWHLNDLPPDHLAHGEERHVGRRGDDHGGAGRGEVVDDGDEPLNDVDDRPYQVRIDLHPVAPTGKVRVRLTQTGFEPFGEVSELVAGECIAHGVGDGG